MKKIAFYLMSVAYAISSIAFADVTYTYDDLNRLVRADYESGSYVEYGYDGVNNMTQKACHNAVIIGDTDASGSVDLKDVILDLRIVSGITPSIYVEKESSINGDGKIGIEEAIYGLQAISQIRN